jgi:TonB dependent receptor/TonB-dependent Receptor Plug Domain/CarboxypepD_reg-like domain
MEHISFRSLKLDVKQFKIITTSWRFFNIIVLQTDIMLKLRDRSLRYYVSLLSLLMGSARLLSQNSPQVTYTISGVITESTSGETLPDAIVMTADHQLGAASNAFGFYSLTLPAGNYNIITQYVGFVSDTVQVDLRQNVKRDFQLKHYELKEIAIVAEKQERISEQTRMSTVDIPIEQIKAIPALMGEKDVLKVVQLLPGVQKGSEGSTGFYVRGGGPDQNLILLDDAPVYNVNHLFGFFSLFNGDAIKSVELTKGGFPARFGGRLSSVLELRMKDGNKQGFHGEAGIGLLSSRVMVEGPIKKNVSSFVISGRRTYIDLLTQPVILAISDGDALAGYFFYDFNAKYNHILSEKDRLFVSGYFGKDKFYLRGRESQEDGKFKAHLLWGNATGTVRWNRIHSPKMFSNTSFIFTNYRFQLGISNSFENETLSARFTSGIRDLALKYDLDFIPNSRHYVRTGVATTLHYFKPSAVAFSSNEDGSYNFKNAIRSLENALYLEDDWSISKTFKLNAGLRLSNYNVLETHYLRAEPRLALRVMLAKDFSFKAGYAYMNQYLHLLTNAGIGLPTDLWVPATDITKPQQAHQYALGFAYDIPKRNLAISIEGYYKSMQNIIAYLEGASMISSSSLELGEGAQGDPLRWQESVTSGKGWSYGGEFLLQRKYGKFNGWIGYTLSWTQHQFDQINFGKAFYARYDRRHDASLVMIYKKNERFSCALTWVYGTGQAVSVPLAVFGPMVASPNHMESYLDGYNRFGSSYYNDRNNFRMKAYHRMDIAFQWAKKLKRTERTFELALYNAYSRRNPYIYFVESTDIENSDGQERLVKQISLFPILPSVSWNYKW